MEIGDAIQSSFHEHADSLAVVELGTGGTSQEYSFQQIHNLAGQVVSLLASDDSGDATRPAALFLQRSANHIAAVWAGIATGKPFFSLNPKLSASQVTDAVKLAGASHLITDNACLIRLSNSKNGQQLAPAILHFSDRDTKPFHEAIVEKLSAANCVRSVSLDRDDFSHPIQTAAATGAEDALYLFTSGSTGSPKCVPVTRSDLLDRVQGEIRAYKLSSRDRLLSILPFSFDVGCNQLFTSLVAGCTLILQNSWLARDVLDSIETHSVSGISGVPSIWESLLESDFDKLKSTLKKVRYITVSGGDLSKSNLDRLREVGPELNIIKTYGQTETFRSSLLAPEYFDSKRLSVGRPFEGAKFFVIRDDGTEAATGEKGEIVHEGVGTMRGYLGESSSRDAGKLRRHPFDPSPDSPTVVFTGDRGEVDKDGFLFVHGRMDRMMKIRGNRVYPEEVEQQLVASPGILDAIVSTVRVEDEETLKAAVITNEDQIDLAELRRELARTLPTYMIPEEIRVLDEFPKTPSGKTDIGAVTALIAAAAQEVSTTGKQE